MLGRTVRVMGVLTALVYLLHPRSRIRRTCRNKRFQSLRAVCFI